VDLMTFPATLLDLILVFTLLEWLVLALRRQRTGRGMPVLDLSLGLLPGFLLMLALRVAAPSQVPAEALLFCAAAGLAHASDFLRRNRQADHAASTQPLVTGSV
jgi:hypothetical protein